MLVVKIDSKGFPNEHNLLFDISIEYLTELYYSFKPDKIIIVSGPRDPYYQIIKTFLNKINVEISNYPTMNNPLIKVNNICWTYHPNYLNEKKHKNKIIEQIKSR